MTLQYIARIWLKCCCLGVKHHQSINESIYCTFFRFVRHICWAYLILSSVEKVYNSYLLIYEYMWLWIYVEVTFVIKWIHIGLIFTVCLTLFLFLPLIVYRGRVWIQENQFNPAADCLRLSQVRKYGHWNVLVSLK